MMASELISKSQAFLSTQFYVPKMDELTSALEQLKTKEKIVSEYLSNFDSLSDIKDTAVYAPSLHEYESCTARLLLDLASNSSVQSNGKASLNAEGFGNCNLGLSLTVQQQDACALALHGPPLLVLTGGPGTGKTVTIRAMVTYIYFV